MLEIRGLAAGYGAVKVLRHVDLTVAAGEMVVVLGPNGAGKTTLLRAASGILPRTAGSVTVTEAPGAARQPWQLVSAGVSHVPEGRELFASMTVADNLDLGAWGGGRRGPDAADARGRVLELFPELAGNLVRPAGSLSGGQQQMLAIGRALMGRARYLLLDEPSLGLAPLVSRSIVERVRRLCHDGAGVLLVEQNARMALALADRVFLLEGGVVRTVNPATEASTIEHSYMGTDSADRGTRAPAPLVEALAALLSR